MTQLMKKIELEDIIYQNNPGWKLSFKYNVSIINLIKNIPGRIWDNNLKCWIIPKTYSYDKLKKHFFDKAELILTNEKQIEINNSEKEIITHYTSTDVDIPLDYVKMLELKRYASPTKKTYIANFKRFVNFYRDFEPKDITKEQIKDYV